MINIADEPCGSKSAKTGKNRCIESGSLRCFSRPRFFAGQLLTEEDLNHLKCYLVEKNKLHNRYLHGWGVVCGLQVACHTCEGWVTVKPGYALDPSGNDIIICKEHNLDVIKHIKECRRAARQRRLECEPLRFNNDEAECEEEEEHWCITLNYHEREARPIAALHRATDIPCDNGNNSHFGCHNYTGSAESYSPARTQRGSRSDRQIDPCEPTRIYEGYQVDIVKTDADYCKGLASALQGTMLCRMVRCITNVFTEMYNFLQTRIPGITLTHTLSLFSPSKIDVGTVVSVELRYEICGFFHQIVKNLYLNNPLNVRCSAIETLKKIYCPASPPQDRSDENIKAYHAQLQTTTEQLVELLLQYFNDCFCQAILPPCPPEPADNRMILACLTIKNDKIVNICNLSCRRYAGSFTSLSYWFPIRQVMGILLQTLCCDQNFFKIVFPIFRPLARMFVPARMLYQKVSEDNFATFKMYSHQFEEIFNKISPENLETFIHPNAVNLATLIDKPVADVNAAFEKANVSPVWREVTSIEEVPLWKSLTTFPFVSPGKRVVAYKMGDKVLGFERYEEYKKVSEEQIEIETLKKEIATLRNEMAVLRKRVEQT